MNKYTIVAATIALAVLAGGCSSKSTGVKTPENSVSGTYEVAIPETLNTEAISRAVTEAGEAQGWIMTPMGRRSIVASRYVDGKSESVVIKYSHDPIEMTENRTTMSDAAFANDVKALQEAIAEALKAPENNH